MKDETRKEYRQVQDDMKLGNMDVQVDEDSPVLCCAVQHVCMYVSPLSPSAPNS